MDTQQNISGYTDWETIAVAVILLVTGCILIGGDLAGVLSLDRIQNLWPVAIIAVGIIDLLDNEGSKAASTRVLEAKAHVRQLR